MVDEKQPAEISLQLFVQILLMVVAFSIAAMVFFYTYGLDRWRGPWAQRAYYELGDHQTKAELPAFARATPTPQVLMDQHGMEHSDELARLREPDAQEDELRSVTSPEAISGENLDPATE